MSRVFKGTIALCIVMVLFSMTALAVESGVQDVTPQNENVAVQPLDGSGAVIEENDGKYPNASGFKIEYSGVTDGQPYLILIMNDETGIPTRDNLYYIDAVDGSGQKAVFNALPKDMEVGVYEIWLTDDARDGAVSKAASYAYYSNSEPKPVKLGFVVDQNADRMTVQDALYALYIAVGRTVNDTAWTAEQIEASNVDGMGKTTVSDALWILQRAVGKRDENWALVG